MSDIDQAEAGAEDIDPPGPGWLSWFGRMVGVIIGALLVVAFFAAILAIPILLAIVIYHSDPGQVVPKENAGYLDLIISNRSVIWSLRGGLMIGIAVLTVVGFYVVISVAVRTRKGHWLRAGAGLHADVEAANADIEDVDNVVWDLLAEAQGEKDELTARLAQTTDQLELVTEQRDWLSERLEELAQGGEGEERDEDS
jgi:hypothetical protein